MPNASQCAEKQNIGKLLVLHAVNKMVETSCKVEPPMSSYRACPDVYREEGIKPPKGAVVKSYGTERLGKDMP